MGFKIAQGTPTPEVAWFPIDRTVGATSLSIGQLVGCKDGTFNGVAPLAIAAGAFDLTNENFIVGVVVGTNNYPMTELFNATYGQYIASVASAADQKAIMKMGVEGMHPKGDPQPMVQVAMIGPGTFLEAPIYNATYGVATTLLTATAVTALGVGMTTNAADVATIANLSTTYCRTGANAGIYRVNKTAHATVHTYDTAFPYELAIGDTFVMVNLRQGVCHTQINATSGYLGMCIDNAAALTTDYYGIIVKELNLKEAGKEKVIFKFAADHFLGPR